MDEAIAAYRKQVSAAADLASGDLDEIEDHLRTLADELRDRGMPAVDAVTEAARRIGDPKLLAREVCRVRSVFGARLSRARTWSVIALLAPMFVLLGIATYPYAGLVSRYMAECVAGLALLVALACGAGWARPILLGGMAYFLLPTVASVVSFGESPLYIVWHVGVLAFLAPWRRRDLTKLGAGLAGYIWAYGAASYMLMFQYSSSDGSQGYMMPAAWVALIASSVAAFAAMMRSRLSSVAGGIAALALGATMYQMLGIHFRLPHAALMAVIMYGGVAIAMAAAASSSVVFARAR
jgi:hypothetical protein